jgi:hypothetical protein
MERDIPKYGGSEGSVCIPQYGMQPVHSSCRHPVTCWEGFYVTINRRCHGNLRRTIPNLEVFVYQSGLAFPD